MITTKNFNTDASQVVSRHKCRFCGARGHASDFIEKLPAVSLIMRDGSRHYEVQIPGESEPRKFNQRPSLADIARLVEEVEREKQRPKDGKK